MIANGRSYCRKGISVNSLFVCGAAMQSQIFNFADFFIYHISDFFNTFSKLKREREKKKLIYFSDQL